MKIKTFLSIFIISSFFTLASCSGAKSAYDIAVENGFNGTKEEWLESLKGDKGDSEISSNPQGLNFYLLDDGTYGVGVGTASYLSEVVVPEKYNDKMVSRVVDNGFENASLTTIKLPNSIKTISEYAFSGCENLSNLYIGNDRIDVYTFNEFSSDIDSVIVGEHAFDNTAFPSITATDGDDNANCKFEIENFGNGKTINYSAKLNSETDTVASDEITLEAGKTIYNVDFGTYGLFRDIDIEVKDGENVIASIQAGNVGITAPEYNFAPLNGTYPVLVFSLKINDITDGGKIPTFVYLERYQAYNWDLLPENVHTLPNIKKDKAIEGGFHALRPVMSSYIKELYELNPNSKFNLYCVDNYCELALEMLVANNIPESNWTATFLSDGNGTAGFLVDTFAIDNPIAKYDEMISNWKELKSYVSKNGYDNETVSSKTLYPGYSDEQKNFSILARYPYVIAKNQDNCSWWVNRLRSGENLNAIFVKDPDFTNDIISTPKSFYTNNLLKALSEEEKVEFKNLYHFSDEMFKDAIDNNKKVMIILGTDWKGEKKSFYDYCKLTVEYYGTDEYMYYYKGHPGYATSNFPERQDALNKLREEGYDIRELDCAIAAEVILFYNPDVYISGWQSSTFDSVEAGQMACILFDKKIADKGKLTYGDLMDIYINRLPEGTTSHNGITLEENDTYYVLEYNNTATQPNQVANYAKHEFALYNSTKGETKYYKTIDGTLTEVSEDGTIIK